MKKRTFKMWIGVCDRGIPYVGTLRRKKSLVACHGVRTHGADLIEPITLTPTPAILTLLPKKQKKAPKK
jgi:hypothetical protein